MNANRTGPAPWLWGLLAAAVSVVLIAGAWLLFRVPLWPRGCPILETTGLYCTGCGITRALLFLLQGHPWAAFRMNPLLVLALPMVMLWFARLLWLRRQGRTMAPPPIGAVWTLLILIVLYTVARNLPWQPFLWLAPTVVG